MANDNNDENSNRNVRTLLELKDVVVILTAMIAAAAAFFTYGTRITVLESKLASVETVSQEVRDNENDIDALQGQMLQLVLRLDMDESKLAEIHKLSRELNNVTRVQAERVIWARDELEKIKKKLAAVEMEHHNH